MNARAWLCAAVLLLAGGAASSQQSQPQDANHAPQFRSGVTAVPIDIRVVGRDGRPITDLKKEDFTILEDGVPQTIAHFSAQVLATGTAAQGLRARPDVQPFDASPQNHRVFLLLLGTRALGERIGQRLLHPETLDALVRFVRERLLPQDQVAVLAPPRPLSKDYNRVVGFTTDRQKVVKFLETFRLESGGERRAPARPGAEHAADARSLFQEPAALDKAPPLRTELGFEDYVKAWGKQPLGSELDYLHYAIKYLRYMGGEKHLVFVTERGPSPTWEQYKYLTSVASDARVALDTIQIGDHILDSWKDLPRLATDPAPAPLVRVQGGSTPEQTGGSAGEAGSAAPGATRREAIDGWPSNPTAMVKVGPSARESAIFDNPLQMTGALPYDLRSVAAQTGGQASFLKDAAPALARIDAVTRAHYLLAYYPSRDAWNGRFRSIKVLVNRLGATVLFRHGYYARRDADVFDPRRVMSNARIEGAGYQLADIHEIDVKFIPSFVKAAKGGGGEVVVALSIDVSNVAWSIGEDGRHVAHMEVAVYCGDGNDNIIGETRRVLNLALSHETYERMMEQGFAREVRVPVRNTAREVKVIVYDYDADRVGSAFMKVPK